jgi:hypothetical protein
MKEERNNCDLWSVMGDGMPKTVIGQYRIFALGGYFYTEMYLAAKTMA